MRKTLIAGATALAAAGLAAGAGTATAAPAAPSDVQQLNVSVSEVQANIVYDVCGDYAWAGEYRGRFCWKSYGDHMLARDINKDGYWIKVDWHTDYGRDGKLSDGSSAGDGNQQNYNMRESGRIRFQVEVWDENHQVAASPWTDYYNI